MKNQKTRIKFGIMASSTLQMAAMGLMPLVPLAIDHYYNESITAVQTAFTLPMLTTVPAMLTVGLLSKHIGKKIPLITGLVFIMIFGITPALFDLSFPVFMVMLGGFGVGIGSIISSSTGMLADYFEGAERADLMGKQSAYLNLGGMLLAAAVGILLAFGWKTAFFVYLYAVPLILIVMFFIPSDKKSHSEKTSEANIKMKLSSETLFICVIFFIYGVFQGVTMPNVGLLVQERNLGEPAMASLAVSIMTAVGIITGMLYGRIALVIKNYTLPVGFAVMALGQVISASATAAPQLYAGFIVLGFGFSIVMPTGVFRSSQSVDQTSSTLAMSVFFATLGVALFLSPMLTNPLSVAIASGTAQNRYFISAAVLLILTVVTLVYVFKKKKTKH
jgi:MFS family permease